MVKTLPRVLVVDDSADHRAACAESLRQVGGIEIVEAGDGQRALQLARDDDFAVFVLDVNLPDMDGFELASRLRREPRSGATPIVFMSSEPSERTYVMRGYRLGAVDFMVSGPAQGETLAEKCRVFLDMFRKRQELQALADRANRESRDLHERLQKFIREHERLRVSATLDALTHLPNRPLFHDRLSAAVARAARNRSRFALGLVDLDGVAGVNERHGRAAGDAVIVVAAERLGKCVRATDTVARLGGDEFALLFESIEGGAAAGQVALKAHRALTRPMVVRPAQGSETVEIVLGASIGVALYPEHAREPDDLMVLADLTMYAVKGAGGGCRVYPGHSGPAPESAGGEAPES